MMSPAEHYKEADALLAGGKAMMAEVDKAFKANPPKDDVDARYYEKTVATIAYLYQHAHVRAVLATVPEGVYQMARDV